MCSSGVQEDDAKKLVQEAILAGIFNDLGSGSNVDVTTIKKVNGKVEVIKEFNCIKPNEVSELRSQINNWDIVTHIPRGATRTCFLNFIAKTMKVLIFDIIFAVFRCAEL